MRDSIARNARVRSCGPRITREVIGPLLCVACLLLSPWVADAALHNLDISGSAPPLAFRMVDATTGAIVTARDFRGKIVLLYLGYTQCPDVCPLTLQNVSQAINLLGKDAAAVRFLFVTVDPTRDTLSILKQYTAAFSPDFIGLRGDPDEIARLARRFRLAYSVTPATDGRAYQVTHSSAIYVFDGEGDARLLIASLGTNRPDIAGTARDLSRLIQRADTRHAFSSGMPRSNRLRLN